MIIDNCRAHPDMAELVAGKITVAYLPPNVASLQQPMGQVGMQIFKSHLRTLIFTKFTGLGMQREGFSRTIFNEDRSLCYCFGLE